MTTQGNGAAPAKGERPRPPIPVPAPPLFPWLDQLPAEQRKRIEEAIERGRADPGGTSILVPPPRR
jgi:hypothetical protein